MHHVVQLRRMPIMATEAGSSSVSSESTVQLLTLIEPRRIDQQGMSIHMPIKVRADIYVMSAPSRTFRFISLGPKLGLF